MSHIARELCLPGRVIGVAYSNTAYEVLTKCDTCGKLPIWIPVVEEGCEASPICIRCALIEVQKQDESPLKRMFIKGLEQMVKNGFAGIEAPDE